MSSSNRPPVVVIVNPSAGRLSEAERARAIDALHRCFDVEAITTTARNGAISIAADAAGDGASLVVAFGGDGHVNEVANGLAGTSSALGIIPGGTMNVFARALGIPLEASAAAEALIAALKRPARRVTLGQIDDRYFTFSAGCGFDAEAAERVERHLRSKRRFGELFFYWSAFRVLMGSYRHRSPSMVLRGDFGSVPVSMTIACNTGPYAYFADRPVELTPHVSLDGGLDVFALKTMRIEALPFYVWRVAVTHDLVHHEDAFYASDLDGFELVSQQEFSRHVDGEPLGPAHSARFRVVPDILRVRA